MEWLSRGVSGVFLIRKTRFHLVKTKFSFAKAKNRSFASLLKEYKNLHLSTNDLIASFSNEMLQMTGNANGSNIKVIDLIYINGGHQKHHFKILKERYL